MNNETPQQRTTIVQEASHIAIKVGLLCCISFVCAMRGMTSPAMTFVGQVTTVLAIYNIFKNILRYRLHVYLLSIFRQWSLPLIHGLCNGNTGIPANVEVCLYRCAPEPIERDSPANEHTDTNDTIHFHELNVVCARIADNSRTGIYS